MSNRSRKLGINFENMTDGVPMGVSELTEDLEELIYLVQGGFIGDEDGQLSVFDWLSDLEFIGEMASNLKREISDSDSIPSIKDVKE